MSQLPAGFDPDFDDTAWNLDWLDIPIRQIPVGEAEGGYRVIQEQVAEAQIFDRPYRLDPPLDVRALIDPAGTLWMSDTPQERIMMINNARASGGHILVGGAGLGLYPQYVAGAASFTIVEHSPVVIKLVGPLLKAVMEARGVPLRFLLGDIGTYLDGAEAGGYDTIYEAARHMAKVQKLTYKPNKGAHEIYNRLFKEYTLLHDYFGRGANDVMKRLKKIRNEALGEGE